MPAHVGATSAPSAVLARALKLDERRLPRVMGDRTVGSCLVRPASSSMYESSLYRKEGTTPRIPRIEAVRRALENDAVSQCKKYGSGAPSGGSARFHTELPSCPQHSKFSWRSDLNSSCMSLNSAWTQDSTASMHSFSGLGFNKRTLEKWFRDINRDGTGVITQRELIIALHHRPDLLNMFCRIHGVEATPSPGAEPPSRREEIIRIKEILKQVDQDGSGAMEWDDFVDFFRRAGMLLEYQTKPHLNRTTLCQELEEARQREHERVDNLSSVARRTAAVGGLGGGLGLGSLGLYERCLTPSNCSEDSDN